MGYICNAVFVGCTVNLDALALFEVEKISGGRAMTPALQTLSCSLLSMAETIGFYFPSITRGNVGYMMIYVNLGLSLVQQSTWNRLLVWNRLKIITLLVLYHTMPYCIMLYHTISHFTNLYHTLSHYITLHISHSDTAPLFRDITSRWMVHYLYCQCVEWWFQMITSNDLVMCWMGWNQQSDMKDHCTHTCIYIYIYTCVCGTCKLTTGPRTRSLRIYLHIIIYIYIYTFTFMLV